MHQKPNERKAVEHDARVERDPGWGKEIRRE
jgi:hypothetical protein